MKPYSRHRLILETVGERDAVTLEELIAATGASPSTVRRDVRRLEQAGQLVSLRGGAVRLDDRPIELPASAKSLINKAEKDAIAREAASLVNDGDTVYLDSGTTATLITGHLRGARVHIITSNPQLFGLVLGPRIDVTVLGGDYLPEISSIAGPMTDRMLGELFFDKAFIGANGVSEAAGVTTFDSREANKKRIAHEHSRETFVLADSSKLNQVSLCRAFGLEDITIITDAYADVLQKARAHILARAIDEAA